MSSLRERLLKSLRDHNVHVEQNNVQVGLDFYKYFLTTYPHLRRYYVGCEKYTGEDIQKSPRFEKLGVRMVLAMHMIATNADHPEIIKAYAREQIHHHIYVKLEHSLWTKFWDVWLDYLALRGPVDQQTRDDWLYVGKIFADECVRYSKEKNI